MCTTCPTPSTGRCSTDVEARPEPGIYMHITAQTDFGYRIIEIWDSQNGFEEFAQRRRLPALEGLGIDRKTEITIKPLHNLFAPRPWPPPPQPG